MAIDNSLKSDDGQGGIPLFDEADLLERLDDDREFAQTILEESLGEIPRFLTDIQNLCLGTDSTALRSQAHTLKGMAANIGTPRLKDVAMRIENAAKEERIDLATELLPELEQVTQLTIDAISNWS
jgi:HPt (histidine-containing phosphotransfer) domain-containing protein